MIVIAVLGGGLFGLAVAERLHANRHTVTALK
jgi:Trk K+ transport system NAD-binding subunit